MSVLLFVWWVFGYLLATQHKNTCSRHLADIAPGRYALALVKGLEDRCAAFGRLPAAGPRCAPPAHLPAHIHPRPPPTYRCTLPLRVNAAPYPPPAYNLPDNITCGVHVPLMTCGLGGPFYYRRVSPDNLCRTWFPAAGAISACLNASTVANCLTAFLPPAVPAVSILTCIQLQTALPTGGSLIQRIQTVRCCWTIATSLSFWCRVYGDACHSRDAFRSGILHSLDAFVCRSLLRGFNLLST